MSIGYLERLQFFARTSGDKDAFVNEHCTVSFSELVVSVGDCAQNLVAAGVASGDIVGISCADEFSHMLVSLAVLRLGCVQVTLPSFESQELRRLLAERACVDWAICSSEQLDLSPVPTLFVDGLLSGSAGDCNTDEVSGEGLILLQTAGTTGTSNLVPFSESQLGLQAERHAEYASERLLRLASVEYNNSKRHRLYCLWNGGTNVFRPKGTVNVPDYCSEKSVSCLDISRIHATELIRTPNASSLGSVKIRTGGSSVPFAIRRALESSVSEQLYVRYAATECGAIAMAVPGQHDEEESVGFPVKGVELQIVEGNTLLPMGASGVIRLRAPGIATGYYGEDAKNSKRFRDGWFYPGDIGSFRADGQLIVHGREDDMIILNGVNVYPVEIERALETHPAVAVAAALPIASEAHGQIPVAAVELLAGAAVTAADLLTFARNELGLHSPRRVVVFEEGLPRTPQGKIMKREIAKVFQNRMKSR